MGAGVDRQYSRKNRTNDLAHYEQCSPLELEEVDGQLELAGPKHSKHTSESPEVKVKINDRASYQDTKIQRKGSGMFSHRECTMSAVLQKVRQILLMSRLVLTHSRVLSSHLRCKRCIDGNEETKNK